MFHVKQSIQNVPRETLKNKIHFLKILIAIFYQFWYSNFIINQKGKHHAVIQCII